MKKGITRLIFSGLALLWLAGFFAYFLVNKSGSLHLEIFLTLGERVYQILLAALIFLAAYFPGKGILSIFPIRCSSALERFLFSQALGLWLVSLLVLASGLAGIMDRKFYLVIFLGILILSGGDIRRRLRQLLSKVKELKPAAGNFPAWLMALFVLPFLLLALCGTLTPPMSYDALEYHLGAPGAYLKAGRITCLEGNVYSNFPALVETLYLLGLILKDGLTAKLIHFFLGIGSALAVFSLSRNLFSRKTALIAAFIFYSYAQVNLLSSQAYVDLGVTFFSLLALTAFIRWVREKNEARGWLFLSAVLCGIACSCKYSAWLLTFLVLEMGILLTVTLGRTGGGRHKQLGEDAGSRWLLFFKSALIFALLTAVVASPWLIKNFRFTGNPIYPFGFNLFGGKGWSSSQAAKFIASPLTISFSDNLMSPLFLLFFPFSLIRFRRRENSPVAGDARKTAAILFGYVFLYYLFWYFFTHRNLRFLIPAAAPLAILTAAGFNRLAELGKIKFLAWAIFITAAGYNLFTCALVQAERSPLPVVTGFETRDEFLLRELPHYPAIKFMNEQLGKEARILFIGEARIYYSRREVLASTVFDNSIIAGMLKRCLTPEEILPKLKSRGITHIFLNLTEVARLGESYGYLEDFNWRLFRNLEKQCLEKVFADEKKGLFVYRVSYPFNITDDRKIRNR